MEANPAVHNLPDSRWMRTAQPSRCVGSAIMLWDTGSGHLSASCSSKPVPLGSYKVPLVALKGVTPVNSGSPLSVTENFVVFAFIENCKTNSLNKNLILTEVAIT